MRKLVLVVLLAGCFITGSLLIHGCTQSTPPPALITPLTAIDTGPAENGIVTSSTVTFAFHGNADVDTFQYRIDAAAGDPWQSTRQTSLTFNYLDEGQHLFELRGVNRNNFYTERTFQNRTFVVDAVKGQSAMFYPLRKTVGNGQSFLYDIKAEEVDQLYAAKLTIDFNHAIVEVDSIQFGPFVRSSGGDALNFPSVNSIDNTFGSIIVNMVVVGGHPKGITGSGIIARLYCRSLAVGDCDFTFNAAGSALRDTLNAAITINSLVNGKVSVK